MPRSKKAKATDWAGFSAWVTTLSDKEALKELRAEAAKDQPRAYVMKRLYHRWRAASARTDLAAIELGKLPGYLVH